MQYLRNWTYQSLRRSESFFKTDMVYLVQGGFWLTGNTIVLSIFSLILSISFARFVSKDAFGIYQFIISIASILGGLTLTGMNNAVTQAVARGFEGVFQTSIRTQLKFGVIPAAVGLIGSLYYFINDNAVIAISLVVISFTLPLINALGTWSAFISGKKDFKYLFIFSQIINSTYYTGLIITVLIFPSVLGLVFVGFILNVLSNLFVYLLVVKKYKPNTRNEEEAISYGKKTSLSSILPMISMNIDNIVIFHFLGATNLAIYAFASNVPERLGGLLRPITTLALPKFSENDPEMIKKIIPKRTVQLFIISLIGGVFYILFSPFLFKMFFPAYLESVIFSQAYAIAVIIAITASMPFASMLAKRSDKIHTLNIIYPIFNIATLCLGGYFFGIWGIILGKIFSNLFLLTSTLYFNKF